MPEPLSYLDRPDLTRRAFGHRTHAAAERPTTTDALIHQTQAERQFPGEGGLDLMGLLRALPRELAIGIETPARRLALTVAPVERARWALVATRTLLRTLDDEDRATATT
jgi:hypothetical protein